MNLKEYISRVKDLEVSCYEQSLYLEELKYRLYAAKNPYLYETVTAERSRKDVVGTGCFCNVLGAIAGPVIAVVYWSKMNFGFSMQDLSNLMDYVIIGALIGFGIGFLVRIPLAIRKSADQAKLNKSAKESNKRSAQKNQEILSKIPEKVRLIEGELTKATKQYQETYNLLQKYYDKGVVFEKYRGMVPICMFHEYLQSGRCSSLTGHEGAYNIYETELRMHIIFVKLDEIIEHQKEIEKNQRVLANAIRESTAEVKKLGNVVQNNLESINENAATSAYYSRQTAMNTAFNAWLGYDTNKKISRALSDRS